MSGETFEQVAQVTANTSFIVLITIFIARRVGVRVPRWVRAVYHYGIPFWAVADVVYICSDGLQWWDSILLLIVVFIWRTLRRTDDWDDEDRDEVSRALWGRVQRFGDRLRVVAPAPGS